eukprot:NODE_14105_length_244_cov_25.466667_g13192_i0.p2 GENE.NODE_14105_length_244_cov_25.466667_g13192_i0~~NODE_14105_length_244_cov_25.466667_g13192_i0.p2  ORF type:complete len:64 (-),score=32.41 NODE_14105_length_244_cov_25.466667_g13192_i0:53-214(-)
MGFDKMIQSPGRRHGSSSQLHSSSITMAVNKALDFADIGLAGKSLRSIANEDI